MGVAVHTPSLVLVARGPFFQVKTLPTVDVFHSGVDAAVGNVEKCVAMSVLGVVVKGSPDRFRFLTPLPKCYLNHSRCDCICKIQRDLEY